MLLHILKTGPPIRVCNRKLFFLFLYQTICCGYSKEPVSFELYPKHICFVALRPKSTAMVMAGRSVHITTLFLGKLEQTVNKYFVHIFSLKLTTILLERFSRREENDHRNYFKINLHESMGPGPDRTRYPWICSQTRICCQTWYQLRYAVRSPKHM